MATHVLAFLSLASVARQLDNRLEKQRFTRGRMSFLDQLGEEIKRIHRRTDTNQNGTHATQERHNDLAPDANGHESPFLADDQISIDTTQTFFPEDSKTKQVSLIHFGKSVCVRKRVTPSVFEYYKKKEWQPMNRGIEKCLSDRRR